MKYINLDKIMTPLPMTVSTEASLAEVKTVFDDYPIHHLPVLDTNKKLAGIISKTDLDKFSWGKTLFSNPKKDAYNDALFHTVRVLDVMTPDVFTLTIHHTVEEAYKVFRIEMFRAIPIMDNDELVGIVTPIDLVKAFILD